MTPPTLTGWGLIPAHAGKTGCGDERVTHVAAHPRSRGENRSRGATFCRKSGSSPLTRGKRHGRPRPRALTGLIPAHAGKTADLAVRNSASAAHPRSRGENTRLVEPSDATLGSSPLTRGKLMARSFRSVGGGLIPAHAGKTVCNAPRDKRRWAHPRSRGENSSMG